MPSTDYQPEPGALPDRLLAWFGRNPEEELTCADIAQKFDLAERSNVLPTLATPLAREILARGRDTGGKTVIKIGPNFPAWKEGRAESPGARMAQKPRRIVRVKNPLLDLDAIQIEDTVSQAARGGNMRPVTLKAQITTLIERLRSGQSFVLPATYRHVASDAMGSWRKQHADQSYCIVREGDASIRINRTA